MGWIADISTDYIDLFHTFLTPYKSFVAGEPLRPPLASDGPADQRLGSDFPALSKRRERKKPIITENVRLDQRVTVRRQNGNTDNDKALPPQADNMKEAVNWTTITKRKPKKKRTATGKDASTGKGSKILPSEVSQPKGQAKPREQRRRTRRAPRTAAVAIKGKNPQCLYAEILFEARRKISLTSLGIDSSKVRPTASGGVIIEIPGADRTQKADTLAGKLCEAFRERKEGEETVDAAEVQGAVAEKGGCTVEEMRVGQIQRMTNGLGLIWVQCPLVAAVRMNGLKKFRLGWSTVKVELLRTRPVQCFKCWQFGHMRGKESGHRLGSEKCGAKKIPIKSKGKAPPKRAAHDLLVQYLTELGIGIAAVSEPYSVPDSPFWHASGSKRAAIYWNGDHLQQGCSLFRRGDNYVAISCGDVKVISCYILPGKGRNRAVAFRRELHELEGAVRAAGNKTVLCGDFNAKSTHWGSKITCKRGDLLWKWASNLGLRVVNTGDTPTCVRPQGTSVVDITWATEDLCERVTNWRVEPDLETLSDHCAILFNIEEAQRRRRRRYRQRSPSYRDTPRWNIKKMNEDIFRASLIWSGAVRQASKTSAEEWANWTHRVMTDVCNTSMPRSRKENPRRSAYWWSPDIAELRESCIRARRHWTRRKCRQCGQGTATPPEELEDSEAAY
ncbi:uncharacterized protein [Linepithema humile]|uniref:uncharacterized protein n=1 Tax=Linepithema humile TaxID=83485 RepID=UPI00351F670C